MKKIILLTNILTPYRVYFYDLLYEGFKSENIEFEVLVTGKTEPNRNWGYNDLKREYTNLIEGRIITLPNNIFIHINYGIKKYLFEKKPDLIISAGTYLYPALWTVLRNRSKIKYSVFYWNESHLQEKRKYGYLKLWIRDRIRNFIFKKFDGFWYGGKLSLEFIEKYSNKDRKKIFVPNLIDDKFYNSSVFFDDDEKNRITLKYNIPNDKMVMLCPARITWVKGQIEFLKLFLKNNLNKNFYILFVGDGDLKNEIVDLIKNKENIQILGYKNQKEILELYSISDFFLLPSLSDPNPLTCIESIWCGLPLLISKNVGNYPEVVTIGKNGFVFDYNEPKGFDDILHMIVNKEKTWFENAAFESLRIANEYYESKKVTNRIINETLSAMN